MSIKLLDTIYKLTDNADKVDGKHASDFATSGHTHSYLPLSGGTIAGTLNIKRDAAAICYQNSSGTTLGWLGITSSGVGTLWESDGSTKRTLLHSGNSSVSKSGETLTVKINGTTQSLTNTNTWRGITDSYSGTSTDTSLSQKGGKALYDALVNGYASSAGHASSADYATSARNADTLDNYHASSFVTVTNRQSLYTSGTAPYAYVYLFRIANTSGYSTTRCDFDIKLRNNRIKFFIDIVANQYPYGSSGSYGTSISIYKETKTGNALSIYYIPTVAASGYNYYDVYCKMGSWQSGQFDLVSSGGSGTLFYEIKKTYLDSLPSGAIEVGDCYYNKAYVASKLETARTVSLTGAVTGSSTFNGSANLSIATTVNHTHNYAGSSSAGGAATSANKLTTARTISLTGSVTGSGSFDGSGNLSIATTTNHTHSYAATNHSHDYLPLAGGTMTGGNISWNSDSHGVYFYNGCGIEKWSGYGPSLVAESGTDFHISSKSNRATRYLILHAGNYTSYCAPASHTHDYAPSSHGHSYFSMNSGISLSSIVATADSTYLWNKSSNAFVFTNWNNAISLVVGGTSNDRNAMIQVGHSASNYGQHTGNLYLNKLGGKVYYGTSEVSVVGHTHSYAASSHTHTKSQITDFAHNHDSVYSKLGHTHSYAASSHTHNYAGSSSAGGAATSANKLNTNAGSATKPVYFSGGVPVQVTGCMIQYWAIYEVYFSPSGTSGSTITKKAGNHNFCSSISSREALGQIIVNTSYPSGFNESTTMIFGVGDHAESNHTDSVYITVNKQYGSGTQMRLILADDDRQNWGYAHLYFLCIS